MYRSTPKWTGFSKNWWFISKCSTYSLQSNLSFRTTNLSVSSFLEVFKDLLMKLVAQKINSCLGTRLACDKVVYLVWCQFHNCYFTIIQKTNLRNFFAWAFWRLTSVNAMSLKSAYTQFMCQNRQPKSIFIRYFFLYFSFIDII